MLAPKRTVSAVLLALLFSRGAAAAPLVVDRIVASVDGAPIVLSTLQRRAKPFYAQLEASATPQGDRIAARREIERGLLDRMIDELLLAAEAKRRALIVTDEEVTKGIAQVAEGNKVSIHEVLAQAASVGLDEESYRREIRTQILEGKILRLRTRELGDVLAGKTQEQANQLLERRRKELLESLRQHAAIEVRW